MNDSEFVSTAIYLNRQLDKEELEGKLHLPERGNGYTKFYIPNGPLFAVGYERIVYGDHGPYIEFKQGQIQLVLISKFNNQVDYNHLPKEEDCKYYYFWLYPDNHEEVKVYLQLKPVTNLPNAPKREDGRYSRLNRKEGYADYKRGLFYVSPYELENRNEEKQE